MTPRSRPFTAEETARILHLRDDKGFSFATIARLLGRPNPEGCRDRYVHAKRAAAGLHGPRERHFGTPRVTLHCLRCRGPFLSADRRSHRLCYACSSHAAGASPFEPDYDAPVATSTGLRR